TPHHACRAPSSMQWPSAGCVRPRSVGRNGPMARTPPATRTLTDTGATRLKSTRPRAFGPPEPCRISWGMRRLSSLIAGLVLLLLLSCSSTAQRLEPVVSGLKQPVVITHANDDPLFVVEQVGSIRVAVAGELLSEPFLDIADQVASGGERGLLGLAFPVDH